MKEKELNEVLSIGLDIVICIICLLSSLALFLIYSFNFIAVQVVHSFKTSSMNKSQVCMVCSKAFSGFLKQGSKCVSKCTLSLCLVYLYFFPSFSPCFSCQSFPVPPSLYPSHCTSDMYSPIPLSSSPSSACGILIHKHCQNRAPLCNEVLRPGQQVIMATEIVVSDTDELDELARFLVVKVRNDIHVPVYLSFLLLLLSLRSSLPPLFSPSLSIRYYYSSCPKSKTGLSHSIECFSRHYVNFNTIFYPVIHSLYRSVLIL